MNANLDGAERGLLDEALFDGGKANLVDPVDDVPEEALLETATAGLPKPEPVYLPPMQVVFPPVEALAGENREGEPRGALGPASTGVRAPGSGVASNRGVEDSTPATRTSGGYVWPPRPRSPEDPDRGVEDSTPATHQGVAGSVWPGLSPRSPGEAPERPEEPTTPAPEVAEEAPDETVPAPPEEDAAEEELPPLRLEVLEPLTLKQSGAAALTAEHIAIRGAETPALIDIVVLSAPTQGTLLRDGFALTGGDVFTQEDIDQGRVRYRHEGDCGEDGFTFATPEGEVPPTCFWIKVVPTRRAPELTQARRLWEIQKSCKVGDILAGAVRYHQPGVDPGMAIVGASGRGEWAYSADGESWRPMGEVHPGSALLLEPTCAIRFVPVAGWSGHARLSYRAWDRSRHAAGQGVDLSPLDAVGGATVFSGEVTVATAVIRAASGDSAVEPWLGQPTAHELVGGGAAVIRLDGPGVWQFSLDGGKTWLDFVSVYHGKALLLGGDDRVRFLPAKGATGKVQFGARLWDGRDGAAGEAVNLSCHGATGDGTPFGECVQTRTWRLVGG